MAPENSNDLAKPIDHVRVVKLLFSKPIQPKAASGFSSTFSQKSAVGD